MQQNTTTYVFCCIFVPKQIPINTLTMDIFNKVKTMCCESSWCIKSKLDYRCNKCGKDVTFEIVLLCQAIEESKELKSTKNKPKTKNQ